MKNAISGIIASLVSIILFSTQSFSQTNNPLINSGEIIKQGIAMHEEGKYKDAIRLYSQVNRSDTNYADALYEMSSSYLSDSQFVKAFETAKLGLKLFPEKADVFYLEIGSALDNLDRSEEAINYFDKAIKQYPLGFNLYFNKAIALLSLKKYDEAKLVLQQTLMLNPTHPSSHFHLASIYLRQGHIIPAMLALNTYLLAAPGGRYARAAIQQLSAIGKVDDEVAKAGRIKKAAGVDNFELVQEILLSKIALDKQYKLKTSLEDPIVRQLQVVMEKLEFNKRDTGFAMRFYVPFYQQVFKQDLFEPMVYQSFSGIGIDMIDTWNKKHKKEIEAFVSVASGYFDELTETKIIDPDQRKNATVRYIYEGNALIGKGSYKDSKKDALVGPWSFYYKNTMPKSTVLYDNQGQVAGPWEFYFLSGMKREKINNAGGKSNGLAEGWFSNGNPWYKETNKDGKADGIQTFYSFNGRMKSEANFKEGKKSGSQKEYYITGELYSTSNYADDKLNGELKTFHKNGKVETVSSYKDDMAEGQFIRYDDKGRITSKGDLKNDKKQGLWTSYYDGVKLKSKIIYLDGEMTGEYTEYHDNGTISETGIYKKGEPDGTIAQFNEEGKKLASFVYDNGRLKEVLFYDKTGKELFNTTTRRGAATITYFDENGNKTSEGHFDKEGNREGEFRYFYASGKLMESNIYKNGKLEGNSVSYYANGVKKYETNYKDGEEDGYTKGYHQNGKLRSEGWMKYGSKQGRFIFYYNNGDINVIENYLDNELNGYTEYFKNNKLDIEKKYLNSWVEGHTQLDSTGKVVAEMVYTKGTGPTFFKHTNGKNAAEGKYENYELEGSYKYFYFDGSLNTVQYFKKGEEDSVYKAYHFGGKPSIDGSYKNHQKHGSWKYFNDNGKLIEDETYFEGSLHGADKIYREDGSLERISNYKNGELDSTTTYFGEHNEVAFVVNYKAGDVYSYSYEGKDGKLVTPILFQKLAGKATTYYKNGTISGEFTYEDNDLNGSRNLFFSNGKPYIESNRVLGYDNGLKKIYYPDGNLQAEENYNHGSLNGKCKNYYPGGKIKSELNFYNNDLHGICKYYDETGKVKQERLYNYGTLISAK